MRGRRVLLAVVVALVAAEASQCAENAVVPRFGRQDHTKFHIFSSAWKKHEFENEDRIREIAECGIDTFCANWTRKGLDFCQKYGISAIVRGYFPSWWGGKADHNGKMAEERPLSLYEKMLADYEGHPSVVAFEIGDEPSALDFEHFGRVAALVERETSAYLNLFPVYASSGALTGDAAKSQLGAKDYAEYLALYCKHVPIPEISFDNYVWGWSNTPSVLYRNLCLVADVCQATRRALVVELQLLTFAQGEGKKRRVGRQMTEGNLRWQSNVALAFGCRQVNWINWSGGWWQDQILDREMNFANRRMYDQLKRVNAGLRRFGDLLVQFERARTDFVCFDESSDGLKDVLQTSVPASTGGAFAEVKAEDGAPLLVGHFLSRAGDGRQALFIVACDDPHDQRPTEHVITFRWKGRKAVASNEDGRMPLDGADGRCMITLKSSHAVFVCVE